ncbi:hypothetical protein JW930_00950 [Candidatus Woesearchaeota archaeon]|nr:hypothetical protein [Candidatus Woesearchaeota archaeon]
MKKGLAQIISFSLIVGVVIFIIALMVFFSAIKYTLLDTHKKTLDVQAEWVFDNLENNLGENGFFKNYRVNASGFDTFASDYDEEKERLVLSGLEQMQDFKDMDFCIYIDKYESGQWTIKENFGNDTITVSSGKSCYSNADGEMPEPDCPYPFTHAVIVQKPILYEDSSIEFARMNILICAEAIK